MPPHPPHVVTLRPLDEDDVAVLAACGDELVYGGIPCCYRRFAISADRWRTVHDRETS